MNFANPEVVEAIKDVMRFWFDLGVDGFRLNVAHLFYQDATACEHHPQTHAVHKQLRAVQDEYDQRAVVGELLGRPEQAAAYYGDGNDELHMVFNFNLTYAMHAAGYVAHPGFIDRSLARTVGIFPPGAQNVLVLASHDMPLREYDVMLRSVPRIKLMGALMLTLPGTPFLHYGQEIGIASVREWIVDPRDFVRTPMHWTGGEHAGFSTVGSVAGPRPELRIAKRRARSGQPRLAAQPFQAGHRYAQPDARPLRG